MRILFTNLIFLILLFTYSPDLSFSQPQQGFNLTGNQVRFAQSLPSTIPSIISASWANPFTLWVEADGVDRTKADEIALEVIFAAKTQIGQRSFCVHVHNGDYKQVAMKCWTP